MTRRPPLRPALCLYAIAALTGVGQAQAQSTNSPYFIGLSQTVQHESNTLGLADGSAVPSGFSRADTISSTALLAGFDQPIGRQRAYANLNWRDNRYAKNDTFNYQSYSASVGLDWSTVERVAGTLTAAANRSLQRFSTAEVNLSTEKNLESSAEVGMTANVGLVTQYSFELGASHREVRNSLQLDAVQSRNYELDAANAGLRWRPGGFLTLSLGLSGSKGRYPKFRTAADGSYQPDRFDRKDLYLSANYTASGASQLSMRVAHGTTKYDLNEQRNFSGTTGYLNWNWQATGKLQTTTSLSRDTGQDSYSLTIPLAFGQPILTLADYSRTINTYRVRTSYAATGRIGVTASLARIDRKLSRTSDTGVLSDAEGRDRSHVLSVGARWAPLRAASVGCDYSKSQRSGEGRLVSPYHNTTFSCFGQITLQ